MDIINQKVSIIMPTYNQATYIMETIQSIQHQTYPNWELIIVDDGSEDNTEEIVTGVKDERLQFYKVGRIGIGGKTKNIGLKKANGELISFMDSDDLWAPTKLEKQVESLRRYPEAGFSLTGGYNFKKINEPLEYFYKQKEGIRLDNIFISCFKSEVAGFTQSLMLRKECLGITGTFKELNSFSDMDFIVNLASKFKAIILYEPLFFRRLHDTNYSNLNWEKWHYQGLDMIRSYKNSLPSEVLTDALFRSNINLGEKYLKDGKKGRALQQFFSAWSKKPFNIMPLKKITKTMIYLLKGK
jgi:glycosyltransferase involved in cell wall biosynthesis